MGKIANNHLWDVNAMQASRIKRCRFVHSVWFLLVGAAVWMGFTRGASPQLLVIAGVLAMLPGLLGVLTIRLDKAKPAQSYGFLIIAWTLLSAFGLVVTGGAGSPLAVLFALGPVAALSLGQGESVIEAAIFGVMAFMAAVVIEALGLMPPAIDGLLPFSSALALAALIMLGFLLWAALGNPELAEKQPEKPASEAEAQNGPPQSEPVIVGLPGDSGHLLMDITQEGRIRGISGDTLGLAGLKVGAVLQSVLAGSEDVLPQLLKGKGHATARLENGRMVRLVSDKHEAGVRFLLSDITEQARLEAQASAELEAAREEMKGQTAFFAGLGHDLKTPLNAILGYSDMMRSGIRGPLPGAYQDYAEIIHESGQDLLLLVDDILDLSKAEVGKHRLEPEPIDLAASGLSVLRQLENQAERRGIKLKMKTKGEVWAQADARAVRQIWQNLLSNAIKYSDKDQTVTLDAYEEKGVAVFSVTDKGAGMDEADLARIAEPFAQGSNARGRAGTGLGLAVVQRFAELHGGQVRIDTAPGKGTRVEVTLPLADAEDVAPFEDAAE